MLTLPNLVYKGKKTNSVNKAYFFKKKNKIYFFFLKKYALLTLFVFFPYKLGSEELTLF